MSDYDSAMATITSLEAQLTNAYTDNENLKQNVLDVENKNKKLFATLEKALADRAREYKGKTEDILGVSPMRSPAKRDDSFSRMSRSPLIDKYTNRSPIAAPLQSQSSVSAMLDQRSSRQDTSQQSPKQSRYSSMSRGRLS